MLESRLIEHLKALDNAESSNFLRFAKMLPLYIKDISDETIDLLKYLLKNIDIDDKLSKEVVYKNIFPKQTVVAGKLEKLMSAALKAFKLYVQNEQYINNTDDLPELLAMSAFYRKKQMHKLFELNSKQLEKYKQEATMKSSATDFYNIYCVENELFEYQNDLNTREDNLNLPETIFAIDTFYLIKRLDLALHGLIQNSYIPFDHNEEGIAATIQYVIDLAKHPAYVENLTIKLYIDAIKLQYPEKDNYNDIIFRHFCQLLSDSKGRINIYHYNVFGTVARNYCTKQYNSGNTAYLTLLFDLISEHLEDGILYQNDKIRASTMLNIVTLALKLKKYDFADTFLAQHKEKVTGTRQPDLVWQFNVANYQFETGKFYDAIESLPNYQDLEDTFYALTARRLEIKILFETENDSKYDVLGNKIDAYKNFLFECKKNNRLTQTTFDMNNEFVDTIKQLRNTLKSDTKRLEKINIKIEQSIVAEREWLLKKVK